MRRGRGKDETGIERERSCRDSFRRRGVGGYRHRSVDSHLQPFGGGSLGRLIGLLGVGVVGVVEGVEFGREDVGVLRRSGGFEVVEEEGDGG